MTKTLCFFLADDDEDDVFLFREVLREVVPTAMFAWAEDGQSALDKLRSNKVPIPHIIFLDLNMPRLDGRQCLLELKKDEALQNIPVVMYSTSSQHRDTAFCMANGAAGFIVKPSSIIVLKKIISGIAAAGADNLPETIATLNRPLQN